LVAAPLVACFHVYVPSLLPLLPPVAAALIDILDGKDGDRDEVSIPVPGEVCALFACCCSMLYFSSLIEVVMCCMVVTHSLLTSQDAGESEELNERAKAIIKRIIDKLTGFDFDTKACILLTTLLLFRCTVCMPYCGSLPWSLVIACFP
jgi:hypothetical protein